VYVHSEWSKQCLPRELLVEDIDSADRELTLDEVGEINDDEVRETEELVRMMVGKKAGHSSGSKTGAIRS